MVPIFNYFWTPLFLLGSQLFIWIYFKWMHYFLLMFSRFFSLPFTFRFTMMYLIMGFFTFILFGAHWVSRIYRLYLSNNLGNFSVTFLGYYSFLFISFLSSCYFHHVHVGTINGVIQVSEAPFICLHSFSHCYFGCITLITLFSSLLSLSISSFCF